MKNKNLLAVLLFGAFAIAGCSSSNTVFGMKEDDFNQLNDAQKQQVIADYNQSEKNKYQLQQMTKLAASALNASGVAHQEKVVSNHQSTPKVTSSQNCTSSGGTTTCQSHSSSSSHSSSVSVGIF